MGNIPALLNRTGFSKEKYAKTTKIDNEKNKEYHSKTIDIFERASNAITEAKLDEYDKIEYELLELIKETLSSKDLAQACLHLGFIYIDKEKYLQAIFYSENAFELDELDPTQQTIAIMNLGELYRHHESFEKLYFYYKKAILYKKDKQNEIDEEFHENLDEFITRSEEKLNEINILTKIADGGNFNFYQPQKSMEKPTNQSGKPKLSLAEKEVVSAPTEPQKTIIDLRNQLKTALQKIDGVVAQNKVLQAQLAKYKLSEDSQPQNETQEPTNQNGDEIISPTDLRDRRGVILDRVASEGVSFTIVRRGQTLARLIPSTSPNTNFAFESEGSNELVKSILIISTVDLRNRRGAILDQLSEGKRFLIVRKGKPTGMLVSPEDALPLRLPEEIKKFSDYVKSFNIISKLNDEIKDQG